MFPNLPIGPLSLPTAPIFAMLAFYIGLDAAARYARRLSLHPDHLWNCGLLALAAGLIVARLWNVFQFWPIYREEPLLILSIRPSGFALWPGIFAAFIAGYLYLLRHALDPAPIAASLAIGGLASAAIFAVSAYLTGSVVGLLAPDLPWAQPYFGELRHPTALYMALGYLIAFIVVWLTGDLRRPRRTFLLALLAYSLVRLITDGFRDGSETIANLRISQLLALLAALILTAILARQNAPLHPPATPSNEMIPPAQE